MTEPKVVGLAAKALEKNCCNNHAKHILLRNLSKANAKLKEKRVQAYNALSGKITEDFAYSLGALLGDGFISFPKSGGGFIGLSVRDKDFAEAFKKRFDNWTDEKSRMFFYDGFWKVHKNSITIAKVMCDFDLERLKKTPEEVRCAFLKGIFDAEGSFNAKYRRVRFFNTDENLIMIVVDLLKGVGIECAVFKRGSSIHAFGERKYLVKPLYTIHISRYKNIFKFNEKIGFSIERKQSLLKKAIASYKLFPEKWKEEDVVFLKRAALNKKNMSISLLSRTLAEEMGRSPSSIRRAFYRDDFRK